MKKKIDRPDPPMVDGKMTTKRYEEAIDSLLFDYPEDPRLGIVIGYVRAVGKVGGDLAKRNLMLTAHWTAAKERLEELGEKVVDPKAAEYTLERRLSQAWREGHALGGGDAATAGASPHELRLEQLREETGWVEEVEDEPRG